MELNAMNDLDTLRPEVREAYSTLDAEVSPPGRVSYKAYRAWCTICAELLRLAGECAMIPRAQLLANLAAANERAEKAEAELATAQNTIAAQQDTMGAMKRKLALSEGELAALKARIAEAPLEVVESLPGAAGPPWPMDHWIEVRMADPCACVGQGLIGKRVRLVVEE